MTTSTKLPHSGGPKTEAGKSRSKRNSTTHGIFSREISFLPEERAEFVKLRAGLIKHLRPENSVEELILDEVLVCTWRIKIGLRGEQKAITQQISDVGKASTEVHPDGRLQISSPYPLTAAGMSGQLKLLAELRSVVSRSNYVPAEYEEPVTRAFGSDFLKTLNEWRPPNLALVPMLKAMLARSELFDLKLPEPGLTPRQDSKYRELAEIYRNDITCKLIDIKIQQVQADLARAREADGSWTSSNDRTDRLDLFMRYNAGVKREFYRALREYRETKNPNVK